MFENGTLNVIIEANGTPGQHEYEGFKSMQTCARSRLRVFSVFVRMVTGRWTSFDSKNSKICDNKNIKLLKRK